MNALTVFLGLMLWTWLWGPWGTVLAVPMLVTSSPRPITCRDSRELAR